jgi:hypothetical protein
MRRGSYSIHHVFQTFVQLGRHFVLASLHQKHPLLQLDRKRLLGLLITQAEPVLCFRGTSINAGLRERY